MTTSTTWTTMAMYMLRSSKGCRTPQAGLLANLQLQCFLATYGHTLVPSPLAFGNTTPNLLRLPWLWTTLPSKYTIWQDMLHLMSALQAHYKVSEDWDTMHYCGLTINWDYIHQTVDLSISGYIKHTLLCFRHVQPTCNEHAPHAWQKPKYGAKVQFSDIPSNVPCLNAADTKCIQEVVSIL